MTVGSPSVVFGLGVHNGERYLAEALESLLAQTRRDLAVVVVDNCSTDETPAVVHRYVELDQRVVYRRNERLLGLVHNWRRAFDLAGELFPAAAYFAWASDHDVWHPRWFELLAAELESHPEAVLAYPRCVRIDEAGAEFPSGEQPFALVGSASPAERLRRASRGLENAGDMIYGLCRRAALQRCGPFPLVVLPDRLHLIRLAYEGDLRSVDRRLWYRRYRAGALMSNARQRRSFFPGGVPPRAYLPWWLVHPILLSRSLSGQRGRARLGAASFLDSIGRARLRSSDRRSRRRRWRRRARRRFVGGLVRSVLGRAGLYDRLRPGRSSSPAQAPPAVPPLVESAGAADAAVGRTYERVRSEVERMLRGRCDGPGLDDFSPSIAGELRRHADRVGGVSVGLYRSGRVTGREHAEKLEALRRLDAGGVLVHEPPILGGFGFELDGGLVNRDTLTFYEALIALERSEVLAELGPGSVVLELGGGWGGFAFQLKTLVPALTYVIVDRPERFLFSAVYLLTAFPAARAVFWDAHAREELAGADFVFVPSVEPVSLPLDRIDLAVSVGSLGDVPAAEAARWARALHEHGARYLYSLNGASGLREALAAWYWLLEAWVLPWRADQWVGEGDSRPKPDPRERSVTPDPARYSHLVGRRRVLPSSKVPRGGGGTMAR